MGHRIDQRKAIQAAFETAWTPYASATPIDWENVKINTPGAAEYVQLSIKTGKGVLATKGNPPTTRYTGIVSVRIFVPEGAGALRMETITEQVENVFWDTAARVGYQYTSGTNGTITFSEPPEQSISGISSGFWLGVVKFPFYRDQRGA